MKMVFIFTVIKRRKRAIPLELNTEAQDWSGSKKRGGNWTRDFIVFSTWNNEQGRLSRFRIG